MADSQASSTVVWPCAHGALVELAGEHDVTTLSALRRAVAPLYARDDLLVVVDLSQVTFIDASVLSLLAGLRLAVTGRGGELRLRPGNAELVIRVLELAGWLPCAQIATGPSGVPDEQRDR